MRIKENPQSAGVSIQEDASGQVRTRHGIRSRYANFLCRNLIELYRLSFYYRLATDVPYRYVGTDRLYHVPTKAT